MRVLIIGADGAIGKALGVGLESRGHTVIGTTRRGALSASKERIFLDLAAPSLPKLPQTDVAVICAAMSRFADCRNAPDLAHRVNVTVPLKIAMDVKGHGGRVLLLSSSVVFDCLRPHVKGDAPTAPRTDYGRLKADAEAGVLGLGGSVLRLTKVVTPETGTLVDWILALRQGRSVRAFQDHRFCPISLHDVIDGMTRVIEQPEAGVFQLSGAEDISYADAARHLADRLGVLSSRVEGSFAVESGIPGNEVTAFTSLDTSRLSALTGFVPPTPRAVIDRVYQAAFSRAHVPLESSL